jgi:hypothetical protein
MRPGTTDPTDYLREHLADAHLSLANTQASLEDVFVASTARGAKP